MKLQLALIILGLILIGLVFAISRYPDTVERFRRKIQHKKRSMTAARQAKSRNKQKNKSRRVAHREPILGDADMRGDVGIGAAGEATVAHFGTAAPQFEPDAGAYGAES